MPTEVFTDRPWTSMVGEIATTYLPGVALDITTDPARASATFEAGTPLRQVFDHIRRGLIAATGARWEYDFHHDAGVKTLRWFKRDTVATITINVDDLVAPLVRDHGSVFDVGNEIYVEGTLDTVQVSSPASKSKYLNLVPGGILSMTRKDDFLSTTDMVTAEANSLLDIRRFPRESLIATLPLRLDVQEGKRVVFGRELCDLAGLDPGIEFDVVEVAHDVRGAGTTTATLNERSRSSHDTSKTVASIASQRTL